MIWEARLYHNIPVFPSYCICAGIRDKVAKKIGASFDYLRNINGNFFIHLKTQEQFANYLNNRLKEDRNYVKQLVGEVHSSCKSLIATVKRILRENSESGMELTILLKEFIEVFENLAIYFPTVPTLIAILENMLRNKLKTISSDPTLLDQYFLVLISPRDHTRFGQFNRELLQLAVDISKTSKKNLLLEKTDIDSEFLREYDVNLFHRVDELIKKFGWLNFQFCFGSPFSHKEVLDRLKYLVRSDPSLRLEEIERYKPELQRKLREITKKHSLSNNSIEIAKMIETLAFTRHYKYERYSLAGVYIRPLFEKIGQRMGLSYNDVSYLTPGEIMEMLDSNQVADSETIDTINSRQKGYAMIMEKGEIKIYTDEEIQSFVEKIGIDSTVIELKGKVASIGMTSGKVKIVLKKDEFDKIQEGDILVAAAITPEHSVLMDKVAAIVADVGGITSHTAHIAREMGIPCITGTKVGTKILRDGELVEVDAIKGIVKKI